MKTHVLKKVLLPMLALFFAVNLAFATNNDKNVDETATTIPGYIYQDGVCMKKADCDLDGEFDCTFSGNQLFAKISKTICGNPLKYNR